MAYGKEIHESFSHEIELIKDSTAELYYFTNPTKTTKKTLTETVKEEVSASVLGITSDVGTAKTVTTALALLILMPLLGYVYTARTPYDKIKKMRPYIVKGAPGEVQKKVVLRTPKDIETTFELLDKPIPHYIEGEDVYAIIEGDISYEYRKPLPEEKKDN